MQLELDILAELTEVVVFSAVRQEGIIYAGEGLHGMVVDRIYDYYANSGEADETPEWELSSEAEFGFLTNKGRFLSRTQAMSLQKAAGKYDFNRERVYWATTIWWQDDELHSPEVKRCTDDQFEEAVLNDDGHTIIII